MCFLTISACKNVVNKTLSMIEKGLDQRELTERESFFSKFKGLKGDLKGGLKKVILKKVEVSFQAPVEPGGFSKGSQWFKGA